MQVQAQWVLVQVLQKGRLIMSAYSDYACGAMSYEEFKSTVAWEAAKERAEIEKEMREQELGMYGDNEDEN